VGDVGALRRIDSHAKKTLGLSFYCCTKGLSPNIILAAIFKNRLFFSKNFSTYIPYKLQNLFEKTITIFENFASKAHSATDP
jgi:hypothetical protein